MRGSPLPPSGSTRGHLDGSDGVGAERPACGRGSRDPCAVARPLFGSRYGCRTKSRLDRQCRPMPQCESRGRSRIVAIEAPPVVAASESRMLLEPARRQRLEGFDKRQPRRSSSSERISMSWADACARGRDVLSSISPSASPDNAEPGHESHRVGPGFPGTSPSDIWAMGTDRFRRPAAAATSTIDLRAIFCPRTVTRPAKRAPGTNRLSVRGAAAAHPRCVSSFSGAAPDRIAFEGFRFRARLPYLLCSPCSGHPVGRPEDHPHDGVRVLSSDAGPRPQVQKNGTARAIRPRSRRRSCPDRQDNPAVKRCLPRGCAARLRGVNPGPAPA